MHLDSLKIQNFRLLEDIEVRKLGHVNLIVGKNNSGKSTVLEALALLASGFDSETVNRLTKNREVSRYESSNEQANDFSSLSFKNMFNTFRVKNKDIKIFIGNSFFFITIKYGSPFTKGFKDNKLNSYYISGTNYEEKIIVSSNFELNHLGKTNKFFEAKYKPIFNYQYIDTNPVNIKIIANEWEDIILTEAEDLALQMLRLIEPKIIDLAFINQDNQRTPFVRLKDISERTPLHSMGDGIFRLLQIILKVLKARDGFLLIDEFENGLHYSVQPEVWRLIFELAGRYNIQVFATTHSWDCIESFAQVAKEREDLEGVLFRMGRSVRKSDNGKVIATEFDEDELYNLTKDNIEVR